MTYAVIFLTLCALWKAWVILCNHLPCPKRVVTVHIEYNIEHDFFMVYQLNHEGRCLVQQGMMAVNLIPELIRLHQSKMELVGRDYLGSNLIDHAFMLHLKQRNELNDLKRDGGIHNA